MDDYSCYTPEQLGDNQLPRAYNVSKKKKRGNRDSMLNLSKPKRKIIKLLLVDEGIFIYLSYGTCTLVVHIGSEMAAQQ